MSFLPIFFFLDFSWRFDDITFIIAMLASLLFYNGSSGMRIIIYFFLINAEVAFYTIFIHSERTFLIFSCLHKIFLHMKFNASLCQARPIDIPM